MFRQFSLTLCLVTLMIGCPSFSMGSIVYDLNADWSDSSNPNGPWSYQQGDAVNTSTASWTGDAWSMPQPGWEGDFPQVWFQSNGTELFAHDWVEGDIITHSGSDSTYESGSVVAWTSPAAGEIEISGAIWQTRDVGRSNDWLIYVNNTLVTGGSVAGGDSHTRASPFLFQNGSGGAGVLQNISIAAGDVVSLRVIKSGTSPSGDYAGVNLSIDLTPSAVPEPASLTLVGLGAVGMAIGAYRRRRSGTGAGERPVSR